MSLKTLTLLLCVLAPGCGAGGAAGNENAPRPSPTPAAEQAAAAAPALPKSATCSLISDEEMKAVLGEAPVTGGQGSEHAAEGVSMSQCFFRLPTFDKSVSLEVVSGEPGALREYWRKRFHPDAVEARDQLRKRDEEAKLAREEMLKREREAGGVREGGRRKKNREEEHWRPERVAGLGEEAYWSGNQKMWTLAVLRRGKVVRVTLAGGPDVQAENLKRATELARGVLKRL